MAEPFFKWKPEEFKRVGAEKGAAEAAGDARAVKKLQGKEEEMTGYANEAAIEYEKSHRLGLFELRGALESAAHAARRSMEIERELKREKSAQEIQEILSEVQTLVKRIEEKINGDVRDHKSGLNPYA